MPPKCLSFPFPERDSLKYVLSHSLEIWTLGRGAQERAFKGPNAALENNPIKGADIHLASVYEEEYHGGEIRTQGMSYSFQ